MMGKAIIAVENLVAAEDERRIAIGPMALTELQICQRQVQRFNRRVAKLGDVLACDEDGCGLEYGYRLTMMRSFRPRRDSYLSHLLNRRYPGLPAGRRSQSIPTCSSDHRVARIGGAELFVQAPRQLAERPLCTWIAHQLPQRVLVGLWPCAHR